jgi:DNA-binding XRE family transcriptional regulator
MTEKKPRGLPGLRVARDKAGMTQYALAAAIGVFDRQIQNWERGRTDPSVWVAADLARVLGVTVGDLLEVPQ